jgi:CTP synthase (UTP-ammonia lyase)
MTTIALLGDRDSEFETHRALDATLASLPADVHASWVATDSAAARHTGAYDAVWISPGSPFRDEDAVLRAIGIARVLGQPLLGTCAGFQYSVIEIARNTSIDAGHAENPRGARDIVVDRLACGLYGERRTVRPVAGTHLADACGTEPFEGYHFCGFGLRPEYVPALEYAGVVISAWGDDAGPEAIELKNHPFFVATLFQPQMADPLHPLIGAFVNAAQMADQGVRAA